MTTLVLCDDHRFFLEALAMSLPTDGDRVVGLADDPDEVAVQVARTRPDVCVLDLTYAGVERPDLPVLLKELVPSVTVVLLTAARTAPCWALHDDGSIDALVSKSSSLAAVRAAIVEARAGRRPVVGLARRPLPRQRSVAPAAGLTLKERQVLAALVEGCSTTQLQERLGVSRNTVRTHVQHVLDKLQVGSRTQAVQLALAGGHEALVGRPSGHATDGRVGGS